MAACDDNELVSFIQKDNDADAFVELTKRYMALIRAKAAPYHSIFLDADDLCQEGLLALQKAARSYRTDKAASFRTYAGTCIANRIITVYRASASKKNLPLNNSISLSDDLDLCFTSSQISNPEALLIDRENLQIVKSRINQTLSKMEQQVLSLYLGGCSYEEISQKLQVSIKAVDNAIQRIRRKLKAPF